MAPKKKPAAAAVKSKPAASVKKTNVKTAAKKPAGRVSSPLERAEAAQEVCRKLNSGEVKERDLGNTPDTVGYTWLCYEASAWIRKKVNKGRVDRMRELIQEGVDEGDKEVVEGEDNPDLIMLAHVVSWEVDGGSVDEEKIFKILFSNRDNTKFYSIGVEGGYFIRDGANQFREHLAKEAKTRKVLPAAGIEKCDMKCLENELVDWIEKMKKAERA
mmetsp:Transcript_36638/g.67167  ORF Transcript_36638/g.67167 Transcript_36638/m.67167 type:complete len:216 (+) Transcript_36638:32-679(+)